MARTLTCFACVLLLAAGAGAAGTRDVRARPLPCVPPGVSGDVVAAAPTVPFTLRRQGPRQLLRTLLGRLGDRLDTAARVSGDADLTYLRFKGHGARSSVEALRVGWEESIVAGAFRDMLCAARAALLWSWVGSDGMTHAALDQTYPYLQRFPSPPEAALRRKLAAAAERWNFRVLQARYLRPLQAAPMIVVRTATPFRLARAAGAIRQLLDPVGESKRFQLGAWAYEGFYFEAKDASGRAAFAFANAERGTGVGSQWARCERLYPFVHSVGLRGDRRPCT